jgi:integration host factor subunit beta
MHRRLRPLPLADIEYAIRVIQDGLIGALLQGRRIEVRDFGNFRIYLRRARIGRNPKTGDPVLVPAKGYMRFSPGRDLRQRIQSGS